MLRRPLSMAIAFRPVDFLQPWSLLRYRTLLARGQWWSPERMRAYQTKRLKIVLAHAQATVPYYRAVFAEAGLRADDIASPNDLTRLPILTKHTLRVRGDELMSTGASRMRVSRQMSTGTTGPPVTVSLDKQTNALEFAFYWRQWGWFGYRLGDPFAQFSWSEFKGAHSNDTVRIQRGTGRLLLNALSISADGAAAFAGAMRRHRTRFLKGHPAALLHFALFVKAARLELPPLRAVFTTGEVLEPGTRAVMRDVFAAAVADAYGSMERVVSACECPAGRMHVNEDYGAWELVDVRTEPETGKRVGRVVGTGLHNMSMPLVRYDMGDLVEIDDAAGACPCGRSFPTIGRIRGRSVDGIVTPDGRVVTVAAIVFNEVPSVALGQLVQEELGRLRVRVLPTPRFDRLEEERLLARVRTLMGADMALDLERVDTPDAFGAPGTKHRTVISTVAQRSVEAEQPLP